MDIRRPGGATYGGANALNAAIDEVYIYGSVLSAAQVNTLYQSTLKSNLPPTTALQIASGATFDLNGFNQTIGSLADFGVAGASVTNSDPAFALAFAINPSAGSTSFGGVISDLSFSNAVTLIKNGSGTQILSGANTYRGGTVVNAGALVLGGSGTLGTPGRALRVSNGAQRRSRRHHTDRGPGQRARSGQRSGR